MEKSLFCAAGGEGARGRQLNWPARVKALLFMPEKYFHGREILQTMQKSPSQRDREDGQRAKVNTISFVPENIGIKDQRQSSSFPFKIKHRSLKNINVPSRLWLAESGGLEQNSM